MIWRVLVTLAGAGVVAAATHANVIRAGGYQSESAALIITIAVLLALGMGYAAMAWRDGRRLGAVALGLCVLSGEAYWLATNAEREIAVRDELAAPAEITKVKRQAAEARVAAAERAKTDADTAAVTEAAKPGCRANCANLLMDAKNRAEKELREARDTLAALPPPRSATPLPDRLGLAPWAWDLIMAALRSLAVVGGSIAIALALHPARRASAVMHITSSAVNSREHVAQFLRATLRPDPVGSASLRKLHEKYPAWCAARAIPPLPPEELGHELRVIVDALDLEVEPTGRDVVVRGAAIAA